MRVDTSVPFFLIIMLVARYDRVVTFSFCIIFMTSSVFFAFVANLHEMYLGIKTALFAKGTNDYSSLLCQYASLKYMKLVGSTVLNRSPCLYASVFRASLL